MKAKLKRVALGALCAGTLALTLAGCADEASSEPTESPAVPAYDVAIVHANRGNSTGDLSLAKDYVEAAVRDEGFVAIVCADGRPQSISGSFALAEENGRRRQTEIDSNVNAVMGFDCTALSPESNILAALYEANNKLGSPEATDRENLLIVIDSGISTAGAINFSEAQTRNALLKPENLVDALREEGELAKFDNIDRVIWFGLGEASEPQQSPNEGTKAALKNLYRTLLDAGGVELPEDLSEVFKPGNASQPVGELPEVTNVELPRIPLDEEGNPVLIGDSLKLDEKSGTFTFEFGTSKFVDEQAAREGLQELIDQLLYFPDVSVTIRGYTDKTGSKKSNKALSKERARTVEKILRDAGIAKNRIKTVGKGESDKFEDDAQNRRVEIELAG